jgi:hypothetical protein
MTKLEVFFESIVDIPRIKVGKRQTVETLINEEALLFAKFLRKEHDVCISRIVNLSSILDGDLSYYKETLTNKM